LRFLVDQHLPARLVEVLEALGHEALHVKHLAMSEADDRSIWELATSLGAVVVTKDADFVILAARASSGAPVVRLGLGNCSNKKLYHRVRRTWPEVVGRLEAGGRVIELR